MNIGNLIKQLPFGVKVHRQVINLERKYSNRNILKQLKCSCYHQGTLIWETLTLLQRGVPQSGLDWIERIEAERKRLLSLTEPLNDGSLGQAGLHDHEASIRDACLVSKPFKPALMLFLLTRVIKPRNVIELGTNVGISSAYIGAALKINGQNGRITTLDASPYRQRLAKELHGNLGIDNVSYVNGLFTDTLGPALEELGSVDLAFIDGHHQYQPTLDYFEEIFPFSTSDTVFVFDDIRWSTDMEKAWSRIQTDDRLGLVVDLFSVGICTRCQKENPQRFVYDPIYIF